MSPQERSTPASKPASKRGSSLRKLPGFTAAAVAFVLVVLLGVGGMAVAKWNQSANVTVGITAGAAPTTPVPTTPAPTTPAPTTPAPTTPSTGQGNIVVSPVIAPRPAAVDDVDCDAYGSSGKFLFSWDRNGANGTSYVVSLKSQNSAKAFYQVQTVNSTSASFDVGNQNNAFGSYILRIQTTKAGSAGDVFYQTLRYSGKDNWDCDWANGAGQSPLGEFSVATQPASSSATNNVLNVSWTGASKATEYKVSIKAKNSSYGAEFTTSSLGAILTFPPKVVDGWGNPVTQAAYFGRYDLRIQPMNGILGGDPVYKTVQYQAYDMTVW